MNLLHVHVVLHAAVSRVVCLAYCRREYRRVKQAMTSATAYVDSQAVFSGRAREIGVPSEVLTKMATERWNTIATFAFASSYTPGMPDDTSFRADVVQKLFAADDHVLVPVLRRLYFECFTIMAAEVKQRVERGGPDEGRKLAGPERNVRFKQLETQIKGFKISGPWEPAHLITDIVVDMMEQNVLKYIPWDKCVTRDFERLGGKTMKEWKPTAQGFLSEVESTSYGFADLSSDFKLYQTLARRGMGMHMGGLCSYEVHDLWVQSLLIELQRTPPANFASVTFEQIQRADVELWSRIADRTRFGIQMVGGVKPFEPAIKELMLSAPVLMLMMPLAKGGGSSSSKVENTMFVPTPRDARPKAKPKAQPTSTVTKSAKRKLRQEKTKAKFGNSKTPDGTAICYGFNNAAGCKNGATCKFKHVCQKCFKAHEFGVACASGA